MAKSQKGKRHSAVVKSWKTRKKLYGFSGRKSVKLGSAAAKRMQARHNKRSASARKGAETRKIHAKERKYGTDKASVAKAFKSGKVHSRNRVVSHHRKKK